MNKKLDGFLESELVTVIVMIYALAWIMSGCGIIVIVEAVESGNTFAIILAILFCLSGCYFAYQFYKHNKS